MTMSSAAEAVMPVPLEAKERRAVLENVLTALQKRFYSPEKLNGDWLAAVEKHRNRIETASSADDFEKAMSELLAELQTSHLGFFHAGARRASSKAALSATYLADETEFGKRWVYTSTRGSVQSGRKIPLHIRAVEKAKNEHEEWKNLTLCGNLGCFRVHWRY